MGKAVTGADDKTFKSITRIEQRGLFLIPISGFGNRRNSSGTFAAFFKIDKIGRDDKLEIVILRGELIHFILDDMVVPVLQPFTGKIVWDSHNETMILEGNRVS